MESSGGETLPGEGNTEATNTTLDEAATDASGQTLLVVEPTLPSTQPAGVLTPATAPQAAVLLQSSCMAAELPCSQAGDLRPLEIPRLPSLPKPEPHPRLEKPRQQLLPSARLVEVAHAALQSSGLRLRQAPSAGQLAQQEGVRTLPDRAAGVTVDAERGVAHKREHPLNEGCAADNDAPDKKRLHSEPTGGTRPADGVVHPACAADAVARLVPAGTSTSVTHQALQPLSKRESAPLPPLGPASTISPFARPPLARLGPASAIDVTSAACAATIPPIDAAASGIGAADKASFPHLPSLSAEWQPGCSFTTGRRSTRSPALKGGRNLSLPRAASMEGPVSPGARRGSGLTASGSVFALPDATNAAANAGASSGLGIPAAATAQSQPTDNGATATASAAVPCQRPLETSASADLRRLAQLAEAAAMLEEQQEGDGSPGTGNASGAHCRTGAADDSVRGAAADVGEQPQLRPRSLSLAAASGSGISGTAGSGSGLRDPSLSLRPMGSMPPRLLDSQAGLGGAAAARCRSSGREGSPEGTDADGTVGSPRSSHPDSDAVSNDDSQEDARHQDELDEDGDLGDGSNDSAGGGSGSGFGKSLTERYRAALKASAAQQRGRTTGGSSGSSRHDSERPSRTAVRNGVCARIASITKERLQQVYHLNIEEAARELGIGMTKLKEHCRTLGIPRWPSRKLKSMDKLIESLNERAMTEPATKEVIADILAEIESFKRAIYENPCLEVEEDIKRLRQSNFKKEYQQRQVEQRLRVGSVDRGMGPATVSGKAPSGSGSQLQQGGMREVTSGSMSAAAMAAAAAAVAGPAAALHGGLPGALPGSLPGGLQGLPNLPPGLAAGLGPALMAGQMAAAAGGPAAPSTSQLVQALSQAPQLPGQMPLLGPGQLQQLLLGQPPAAALQQLMTQRALGNMPLGAGGLLDSVFQHLPPMASPPLPQQLPAKPLEPLAAVGVATPERE